MPFTPSPSHDGSKLERRLRESEQRADELLQRNIELKRELQKREKAQLVAELRGSKLSELLSAAEASTRTVELYARKLEGKFEKTGKGQALLKVAALHAELQALRQENEQLRAEGLKKSSAVAQLEQQTQQLQLAADTAAARIGLKDATGVLDTVELQRQQRHAEEQLRERDATIAQLHQQAQDAAQQEQRAARLDRGLHAAREQLRALEVQLAKAAADKDTLLDYVQELQEQRQGKGAADREGHEQHEVLKLRAQGRQSAELQQLHALLAATKQPGAYQSYHSGTAADDRASPAPDPRAVHRQCERLQSEVHSLQHTLLQLSLLLQQSTTADGFHSHRQASPAKLHSGHSASSADAAGEVGHCALPGPVLLKQVASLVSGLLQQLQETAEGRRGLEEESARHSRTLEENVQLRRRLQEAEQQAARQAAAQRQLAMEAQQQLDTLTQQSLQQLEDAAAQHEQEVSALQSSLRHAQRQLEDRQAACDELRQELQTASQQHRAAVEELQRDHARVQQQLQLELQQASAQHAAEVSGLHVTLQHKDRVLQQQRKQLQLLTSKRETLSDDDERGPGTRRWLDAGEEQMAQGAYAGSPRPALLTRGSAFTAHSSASSSPSGAQNSITPSRPAGSTTRNPSQLASAFARPLIGASDDESMDDEQPVSPRTRAASVGRYNGLPVRAALTSPISPGRHRSSSLLVNGMLSRRHSALNNGDHVNLDKRGSIDQPLDLSDKPRHPPPAKAASALFVAAGLQARLQQLTVNYQELRSKYQLSP